MTNDMLKKWWDIFVDGMTEVRILASYGTYSGYFRSYDNLINQLRQLGNVDGAQVYFVLNKINDACYSRVQCERFVKKPKQTTADNDIVRRRWILIDFDPKRPAGTNSTDAELKMAHDKAVHVYKELLSEGFSAPVVAMSGNGYHLLLRVDLPNDGASSQLVQTFITTLAIKFGDATVDVDEKVFNAGRICKLYGTTARKGANNPDRPWRRSGIVLVPDSVDVTDKSVIYDYITKNSVRMEPVRTYQGNGERFTLDGFITKHGIRVYKEIRSGSCTRYQLEECPFDPSHKNGDAALFESSDGKVGFHCFHNSCNGKTWKDVRRLYEPEAVERNEQWQSRPQRNYRQPEPPQPKPENDNDGKKWLSFDDIQNVDIDALPKVLTKFDDLDSKIRGLFYGEFIILSGSNASGKSSWINTLLLNIINQDVKCALWSGELPAPILKAWIRKAAAGRHLVPDQDNGIVLRIPYDTGRHIDKWINDHLYIYNNNYGASWQQVFTDMEMALPLGVRFFVLDNLMALDIDILDESKYDAQKKVVLALKEFAKKYNVIVMLVAHPRKVTSFLRKEDISGSSDITNVPDNVFIIHRINHDFYKRGKEYFGDTKIREFCPKPLSEKDDREYIPNEFGEGNVLEVVKNRMFGVTDVLVGMYYDTGSRRFLGRECRQVCPDYKWFVGNPEFIANNNNEEDVCPF